MSPSGPEMQNDEPSTRVTTLPSEPASGGGSPAKVHGSLVTLGPTLVATRQLLGVPVAAMPMPSAATATGMAARLWMNPPTPNACPYVIVTRARRTASVPTTAATPATAARAVRRND